MNAEFLKGVLLFQGLGNGQLAEILMLGIVKDYKKGAAIFEEGAEGDRLYVIYTGAVRISRMYEHMGEEALTRSRTRRVSWRDVFFQRGAAFRAGDRTGRRAIAGVTQRRFEKPPRGPTRRRASLSVGLLPHAIPKSSRDQREVHRAFRHLSGLLGPPLRGA